MTKAKRRRRKCEHCHGRGYFVEGAGLVALQEKYPDLPMREIQDRGWLGYPDEDDMTACDAAFLRFWEVASHEELAGSGSVSCPGKHKYA
jgi:hypothetical protein